jgi:SDR family mycofactocin-dependent oxidoreductase
VPGLTVVARTGYLRRGRLSVADRVEGKVAFVTGAGRGQGRSHALRLAEEGADIIAIDICQNIESLSYDLASEADLDETADAVRALGRRAVAAPADVRDLGSLRKVLDDAVEQLGRLDIVSANAGIAIMANWQDFTEQAWRDTLDVNLTGVWHTMLASIPHLIASGGGSIVCTGSSGGVKGLPFLGPYSAAKHGVVGIAKSMANELAVHNIRINVVHPSSVDTPILGGRGAVADIVAGRPDLASIFMNALPVTTLQPREISNAVLYLASDEARYVTGAEFPVDAGNTIR